MGICSSKKNNDRKLTLDPAFQKTTSTDIQSKTPPKINRVEKGKSKTMVVRSSQKTIIPTIRNPADTQPLSMSLQSLSKYYSLIKYNKSLQVQQTNLVQHNISGEIRRITTLKKEKQGERYIQSLIDNKINHPGIVRVIDIFQDIKNFHVISEHFNQGGLIELIKKGPIQEEVCMILIYQILEIIKYLHLQNIDHGQLNIGSFGISGKNMNIVKLINIPEIQDQSSQNLNNDQEINSSERPSHGKHEKNLIRDLKSVGIIAYQLMSGKEEVEEVQPLNVNLLLNLSRTGRKLIIDLLHNQTMTLDKHLESSLIKIAKRNLQSLYIQPILNIENSNRITYLHHCILTFMINIYEGDFVQHVLQLFDQYHITKECCLNKQQLKRILDIIVHKKEEIDIDRIFQNIDIDKDENVQFNELIIAMINKSNLLTEPHLKYCFTKLSNNAGLITLQSLLKQIEASPHTLKEEFCEYLEERSFNLTNFIQFMQFLI